MKILRLKFSISGDIVNQTVFFITAYSDSAFSLSKSIMDSDIAQLMLSGKRTKRNFYLKGNVCDSFNGSGWETLTDEETLPADTDALMTLYAIFSHTQDEETLQKFLNVHEQEITLLNIKTQSLFYPLKSLCITADNLRQAGDNIRTGKMNKRGYSYSYQFVDLDYASPGLFSVIEESNRIAYDEEIYNLMFEKMKEYYNVELERLPFSVFLEEVNAGQAAVLQQYTALGDEVSERLRTLADSVSAECAGSYEKAKALERYLYQYHYSKSIDVPADANMLDWFLFDGREGYCAHYAMALAVMLRCVGIPSRIAEETVFELPFEEEADTKETGENIWIMMLVLLGGMVISIAGILFILVLRKRNLLRKSGDPDVILHHLLFLLGKTYFPKEDGETLAEYFERIFGSGRLSEESQKRLSAVLGRMERYWYGDGHMEEEDVRELRDVRDVFLK